MPRRATDVGVCGDVVAAAAAASEANGDRAAAAAAAAAALPGAERLMRWASGLL